MRHAGLGGAAALALLLSSPAHAQGGAPLDISDPTPRNVFVQVESSSSLGTVGQTFGPAFPATWSASGNTGTLTISVETHEQMRAGDWQPIPDTFDPIVFQIDLTTLEATSQPASGAIQSGQLGLGFTQQVLSTTGTAGYAGPSVPPLFCTSQAEIDMFCMFVPSFCGQTCTIVPGNEYDPDTGEINLVGRETQSGCDGGVCQGPFDFFTQRGDLRLTEAAEVPALPGPGAILLIGLLAASAFALRLGRRDAAR